MMRLLETSIYSGRFRLNAGFVSSRRKPCVIAGYDDDLQGWGGGSGGQDIRPRRHWRLLVLLMLLGLLAACASTDQGPGSQPDWVSGKSSQF
ncbi:hypothetical protein MNBD_GAMMA20-328, partial [hydrothermal vent metagenome]